MALAERRWKEEKEVLLAEVSNEKKSHQQTLEALQAARARIQDLESMLLAAEEEVKLLRDISENSTQITQLQEQEVKRLTDQVQQLQSELDAERAKYAALQQQSPPSAAAASAEAPSEGRAEMRVARLEKQLAALRNEAAADARRHADEIAARETQHTRALAEVRDELARAQVQHQRDLARLQDLQQQLAAAAAPAPPGPSPAELEALRGALERERADATAARLTHEQQMASLQTELAAARAAASRRAAKDDTAAETVSAGAAMAAELQAARDEVRSARAALEHAHVSQTRERAEHRTEVARLHAELERVREAAQEDLRAALASSAGARDEALRSMESRVAAERAAHTRELERELDLERAAHAQALAALQQDLAQVRQAAEEGTRARHRATLAETEGAHSAQQLALAREQNMALAEKLHALQEAPAVQPQLVAVLEQRLTVAQEQVALLQHEVDSLKTSTGDAERRTAEWQQQADAATVRADELQRLRGNLQSQLEELQRTHAAELEHTTHTHAQALAELRSLAAEESASLRRAADAERAELARLEQELQTAQAVAAAMREREASAAASRTALERELEELRESHTREKSALQARVADASLQLLEHSQLEEAHSRATARLSELETRLSTTQQHERELEQQLGTAEERVRSLQQQVAALEQQLAAQQVDAERAARALTELREHEAAAERHRLELELQTLDALHQQLRELRAAYARHVPPVLSAPDAKRAALLQTAVEELEEQRRSTDDARRAIHTLREQLAHVQAQQTAARDLLHSTKHQLSAQTQTQAQARPLSTPTAAPKAAGHMNGFGSSINSEGPGERRRQLQALVHDERKQLASARQRLVDALFTSSVRTATGATSKQNQ